MTITPLQGTWTGTAATHPVDVTIRWCDDDALNLALQSVRLAGVSVDTAFSYTAETRSGCGSAGVSQGRVHLAPGSSALVAEIADMSGKATSALAAFHYTRTRGEDADAPQGPEVRGVQVTPDAGAYALHGAGQRGVVYFTVRNAGNRTATFAVSHSCQGNISGCTRSAQSVTIAEQGSTLVGVSFTAGTGDDTNGWVFLTAAHAADPAVADQGVVVPYIRSVLPPGDPTEAGPYAPQDRAGCLVLPAGPGGAYECGDLRLAHALPATRVLNRAFAPVLLYNSQHAHPTPIVAATVTLPAGAAPSLVTATLRSVVPGTWKVTRQFDPWPGGATRRVAVSFDASGLLTGLYGYVMEVVASYPDRADTTVFSRPGELAIVNRVQSPFGAGWWPAGVEQLVEVGDGSYLWVGGDGSTRRYLPVPWTGNSRFVGRTATSEDTLARVPGDTARTWRRLLPGGDTVYFDSHGRQAAVASHTRQHPARFVWAGEKLVRMTLPVANQGLAEAYAYHFEYANPGDRLSRVVAPSLPDTLRAVTVVMPAGRVEGFVGPDTTHVAFGYVGPTAVVRGRYDRRGNPTVWGFHPGNRLNWSSVTAQDTQVIEHFYAPQEVLGVYGPVDTAVVHTAVNGPRVDVNDHAYFRVDRRGSPYRVTDAAGRVTEVLREDPRWPGLATRVRHPGGREVAATYDDAGRLLSTTDFGRSSGGRFATTLYEWDAKWHAPTRVVAPEGEATTFGYDPATGQRVWEQPGPDSARRVRYAHHPRTHPAAPGLVASVATPDGTDELSYDLLGNLDGVRDATGSWTAMQSDGLGRVRNVWTPVDSAGAASRAAVMASGAWQVTAYDLMDREIYSRSTGPALTRTLNFRSYTTPAEALEVLKGYDREGNLAWLSRRSDPDSAGVGTVTTRWEYDQAGRKTVEIAPDNQRDTTWYDRAGNVSRTRSRLGDVVTFHHDALGRLTRREVPGVSRAAAAQTFPWTAVAWQFPLFRADAVGALEVRSEATAGPFFIPGDTAEFTYHPVTGFMTRARNAAGWVSREYAADGLVTRETQVVYPYVGRDSARHVYVLEYDYDLNGRRTSLKHPRQLHPRRGTSGDTVPQRYAYRAMTGELESVTDVLGNAFRYAYDAAGRPRSLVRNGIREEYAYDAFGRQVGRTEVGGGQVLHDEARAFDARGKLTRVAALHDTTENVYTGLGSLARVVRREKFSGLSASDEEYRSDALGNQYRAAQGVRSAFQYTSAPDTTFRRYQAGTGRLTSQVMKVGNQALAPDAWTGSSSVTTYDPAGNVTRTAGMRAARTPYTVTTCAWGASFCAASENISFVLAEAAQQYYDAEQRLRVVDRRSCLLSSGNCDPEKVPLPADRGAFEEYRYDALGRRVLVRSRQEWLCLQRCAHTLRRTVWDGDQVLYEVSAPGWTGAGAQAMEQDVGFSVPVATGSFVEPPETDPLAAPAASDSALQANVVGRGFYFGRVAYTHGPGIDAPLALVRMEYSDSLPGPHLVVLHADWRGSYDLGSYAGGTLNRPCVTVQRNTNFQSYTPDGTATEPKLSPRNATLQHCLEVSWPAPHEWITRAKRESSLGGPVGWMGSLVDGMRDASGQMYRRNRYYDPSTGRFTQEDPIGIAGGLNVYGYANGDPVTYSDPYGLAAEETDQCRIGRACLWARAGQALRAWRLRLITQRVRNAVDDLVETRQARGAEDLGRPATPNGMSMPEFGGKTVMKWGRGTEEARERISTLTRDQLTDGGVTPEIAREWRDFYVNEVVKNPRNPSARGRAELMHRAMELLQ